MKRFAITLAAILIGLAVVLAFMFGGPKDTVETPDDAPATELADNADAPSADDAESAEPDDETPAEPAAPDTDDAGTPEDAAPATDIGDGDAPSDPEAAPADDVQEAEPEYRARFVDAAGDAGEPITIGGLEEKSPYMLSATLSPYRAGLLEVRLAEYFEHVGEEEHYTLLTPLDLKIENAPDVGSYAARAVIINGTRVKLVREDEEGNWVGGWEITEQTASSVTFQLTIETGPADAPTAVARITRVYHLDEGSYSIQLDQSITNLTGESMQVQWEQLAQGDMTWDRGDYLRGRSRQYVLGYFNLKHDPGRFSISTDDGYLFRDDVVKDIVDGDWDSIWPNPGLDAETSELAWLGSVNRYFTIVTSAHKDPATTESSNVPALEAVYPTIGVTLSPSPQRDPEAKPDDRVVMFTLKSQELTLEPGATTAPGDLGLDVFAGPRKSAVFDNAPYEAMRLHGLIRYSLGGPCGICTFKWLADGLMALLQFFHWILGDWGVAIILLVLIVRLCLHPITKRGQTNMMKMSQQMAEIQPDIAKLKKKYADNPQKVQQEQMKLFRERGINPAAGALGCMPMLLQMPIWVALYAMLYYAIELRHESAFYGVFQLFGNWHFLADLSRSDHFITFFNEPKTINLLFIRFDYSGLNVLPLLMAVTFYFNMKFTTPPPANEQQAQQQKIMRFMPFMMPVFLYSAPSGLTLYICASTAAGIVDSYIVRKHVKELKESGKLFEKKERKPGGIMHRIQMAAEQAQKTQQERAQGSTDKPDKNRGPQNFKKRKR